MISVDIRDLTTVLVTAMFIRRLGTVFVILELCYTLVGYLDNTHAVTEWFNLSQSKPLTKHFSPKTTSHPAIS